MRKLAISILKMLNPGTIKIKHHLTKKSFYLDAFLHKGFWYYGKKREQDTIDLFKEIVCECSFVLDIGANIGYFSVYFCELMNDSKNLFVFEPTPDNLTYLNRNISHYKTIRVIEKAVSNKNGKANFFVDNLTGQNNSLLSDYRGFDYVVKNSGVTAEKKIIEVDTITIDSFMKQEYPSESPDFIKIDVEGAELFALQGMKKTLELHLPTIMVEVSENVAEILKMFNNLGYVVISPRKNIVNVDNYQNVFSDDTKHSVGSHENVFCIHKSKDRILKKLKINYS